MTKSFLVFPTGLTGAALLLLRCALAASLTAVVPFVHADAFKAATIVIAAALVTGFCTRIAAALAALIGMVICLRIGGPLGASAAVHGLCAAAASMLGAGGYSIDARLFGRKIIDLNR